MCHQTVSLVARHLEGVGIPTVSIASARDIIAAGRPPRAVFVDYPLGHTAGRPDDPEDQYRLVRAAVEALETIRTPGEIVDLGARWSGDESWRKQAGDASGGDQRSPRDTTPRYQTEEDRRLAEQRVAEGGG